MIYILDNTAQKLKFSIKYFFSKCDQIYSLVWKLAALNYKIRVLENLTSNVVQYSAICPKFSCVKGNNQYTQ